MLILPGIHIVRFGWIAGLDLYLLAAFPPCIDRAAPGDAMIY